jgi:hypothetical protein
MLPEFLQERVYVYGGGHAKECAYNLCLSLLWLFLLAAPEYSG